MVVVHGTIQRGHGYLVQFLLIMHLKEQDAGDQPEHSFIELMTLSHFSNVHNRDKWKIGYWGVARANDVINSVAEAEDISAARAATVVAEAKFIRGWQH